MNEIEVQMELTHFDEHGNARMVDVSEKELPFQEVLVRLKYIGK